MTSCFSTHFMDKTMRNYLALAFVLCLMAFNAIDSSVNHFDHTVIFFGRRSYCIHCSYIKRYVCVDFVEMLLDAECYVMPTCLLCVRPEKIADTGINHKLMVFTVEINT